MSKPKILVFASGSKKGGGSGFEILVEMSKTSPAILDAEIVGVISNHQNGGVAKIAKRLDIPFRYWDGPYAAEEYLKIVSEFEAEFFMLSGWLKKVQGIQPYESDHPFRFGQIVNIHPGPLPDFGGDGMYGHYVHDAVIAAYREGRVKQSAVSIHFVDPPKENEVDPEYDSGPVFFQMPVLIRDDDTPETLGARVNRFEHGWQAFVLNQVVHYRIHLNCERQVIFDGIPEEFFNIT